MAAVRTRSLRRTGSLTRSKSEGTLVDLDDGGTLRADNVNGVNVAPLVTKHSDWPILQPEVRHPNPQPSNPFWKGLSASNPFLDDILQTSAGDKSTHANIPTFMENCEAAFGDEDLDNISTSSDEVNLSLLLGSRRGSTRQAGRWNSASDILDCPDGVESQKENSLNSSGQFLNPDFEWLKNDREAYKMAWLSHRQLTRSCLDLNLMSQSPGWAQTQAIDTQTICRVDHSGGSVQLPNSDISAHVPEGHVAPGEIQEVALRAILDAPRGLNGDLSTTVSPLLEVSLSNLNAKRGISLEMKVAGKIKSDPLSQVMAEFVCLVGYQREGPFQKITSFYVYKDILQIKLQDLRARVYVIAAVQASDLQPPATSVWDYMERRLTVGVYGPKHIHPSFRALCVVFGHNQIPQKLPFSDSRQRNKNMPPLVLQLWGKHQFDPKGLKGLQIRIAPVDSKFEIEAADQMKEVTQGLLKTGGVIRLLFALSKTGSVELVPFKLGIWVKDSNGLPLAECQVLSPDQPPRRSEKLCRDWPERHKETAPPPAIPEEPAPLLPAFRDRPVPVARYGVAMKSVLRQPRAEYLLEYFKGDTVALLSHEPVRLSGQSRVKQWHVGFLRGHVGLVHRRNFKVISREQVIDLAGAEVTTQALLENVAAPFLKLTYMYSDIQSLVQERAPPWKGLGGALGYSSQALDEMAWARGAETEAERVACVLERLKEDCHAEKSKKKFLHELVVGLLKMNCSGLVLRLTQNTVILSTAVQLGVRWRELAERMGKLSSAQISGYEAPHRSKSGEISSQAMWKPAYDFLYTWSLRYGDSHRDLIQDLHLALDKMRNPITRPWRQITGALITVDCMEVLQASAFPKA